MASGGTGKDMVPSQALNICCSVVQQYSEAYCLLHQSSPHFSFLLCRQTKVWKTVALVLVTVAVASFGESL